MNVIEMNVTELKPYEKNPRINDAAVERVALSIKEFGFKVPIVADRNNVIVAGHTRLKAAERLGLATVPVVKADDLTDDQVRAFRLADNKTAELAEWDFAKLWEELEETEMDMGLFGFAQNEGGGRYEPRERDQEAEDYYSYIENEYGEDSGLESFNVFVSCKSEAEIEWLKAFLHEEGTLKRLYRVEELKARE